jgi:hypothetical protein
MTQHPTEKPSVIGERVEQDVKRRIRELGLWPAARTSADWHELGRLRQLAELLETRGGRDA